MKYGRASGDEDLVFHCATYNMSIRTDEAIVSDAHGVVGRAPENSVNMLNVGDAP